MALALTGVGIACLVFLGSVKVTALVMIMVALIDVSLLGTLHYLNVNLNSISVVNLVLALGLSVDYSAHLAHKFLDRAEEDKKRVAELQAAEEFQVSAVVGSGGGLPQSSPALANAKEKRAKSVPQLSGADIAHEAMWMLGASVLNGGISTFVAVAPLMMANSTIFHTFFVMMTATVRLCRSRAFVHKTVQRL